MSGSRFVYKPFRTLAAAAATLALLGCGSPEPGGVEGELLVGTTDPEEGDVQTTYYLHVSEDQGADPELVFTKNPHLTAGTKLRVWGDRVGTELHVRRHEFVEDDFGVQRQALIGAEKKPLTAAIAIVDFGGGSPNLTVEQAKTRMFSTTNTTEGRSMSLKYFYAEQSYGIMQVSGEGFGPIPFTMNGCDYSGVGRAVNAAVGKFDKYVYYFGTRAPACQWSGLGGGNQAWLNNSIGCVVLMQEFGHAVALPHSSTMNCNGASFADDPTTCTHSEYGGRHSPMGNGCYSMTGWERWREQWLQGCNGVRVKSTGTYTIYPLELPCSGAQVLQIPMAKTRQAPGGLQVTLSHYYLELRGPYGIDKPLKPQVLLYAGPEQPVRNRLDDQRAWVLDQNSGDTSINGWGLQVGKAFIDPAGGVSITVQSADEKSATIQVTITSTTVPNSTGDSLCIDNTVFKPGVGECASAPARPDGATVGDGASAGAGGSAGAGTKAGSLGGADGGFAGRGGASASGGTGGRGSGVSGGGRAGDDRGWAGEANGSGTDGSFGGVAGGFAVTGGAAGAAPMTAGASMVAGGAPPGVGPSGPVLVGPPQAGEGGPCSVARVGAPAPSSSWSLAALGLALTHFFKRRRDRARDATRSDSP